MLPLNRQLLVWVLAPYVDTEDKNLKYYYDYTQSIQEFTKAFKELKLKWKWQPVTNEDYKTIIDRIVSTSDPENTVIINLCDGDDINRAPGVNVLRHLKRTGFCFTGADEYYYRTTTSKIIMKQVFEAKNVSTAPWEIITDVPADAKTVFKNLGKPVIVKPAISGGSLGVGIHSVVSTPKELLDQYQKLQEGYHGWNLVDGGVFAEKFIEGPEFTTLIVGNSANPRECKIYLPVERVFNTSLPPHEKFLSFDRLWEIFERESPLQNNEDFYIYRTPEASLLKPLCKISFDAYRAVKGKGYGRVDIRMDSQTGKFYILEVNAQCGLSEDENFTSIGAILRLSGCSFGSLIATILRNALTHKHAAKQVIAKQLELI
jgi:D-alanine-D-alanine ligase